MRAVFSHWSVPLRHNKNLVHGQYASDLFTSSWALSVLSARKIFGNAHLVTDSEGKQLLVDQLGLPFDSVSLELDKYPLFHPDLWAYGKIIAYDIQREPFIHIDYDAFIVKPLPARFLRSHIFAESKENFVHYTFYTPNIAFIRAIGYKSQYFPHFITHAFNCGIFGGNDLELIRLYTREAKAMFEFLNSRPSLMAQHEAYLRRIISIVPEQYMLAVLCYVLQRRCTFLLDDPAADHTGYIHLKGAKGNPIVLDRVKKRLASDFPDYVLQAEYKSIISNPVNRVYMEI